jgi:hypothetical protein
MLHKVFEYQESLMKKLHPVEVSLGYSPPLYPIDLGSRKAQDWFRLMSWYFTEELLEAMLAEKKDEAEELADALHFAVELCILAGIDADEVKAHAQLDMFDEVPWTYQLQDVLVPLGAANNLLKAKHWKLNPQETDPEKFKRHLREMLHRLLSYIRHHGYCFHTDYFAKHKINEQRIRDKY